MYQLISPWFEFERTQWPSLHTDIDCDVAIIGGGISGVVTLYYLLTKTSKKILLLEQNRVASGATGNNAGLVCNATEEILSNLRSGSRSEPSIQSAAGIDALINIINKIGANDSFIPITSSRLGFSSVDSFIRNLECEKDLRLPQWQYLLLDKDEIKQQIPEQFKRYIQFVEHNRIQQALDTIDKSYIAAAITRENLKSGRINSAKLCYQLLAYTRNEFSSRFQVFEDTLISEIRLNTEEQLLKHNNGVIRANDIVLCTNGYKNILIIDTPSQKYVDKIQKSIISREGYLAAFIDSKPTYSAIFFNEHNRYPNIPYFYLSRTPFPGEVEISLSIVGGPEFDLIDSPTSELSKARAKKSLVSEKQFLKNTFEYDKYNIHFLWRGIVGYTKNGKRWVGQDSKYPHLWYNLGCNGRGLIGAITGAENVADLMQLT